MGNSTKRALKTAKQYLDAGNRLLLSNDPNDFAELCRQWSKCYRILKRYLGVDHEQTRGFKETFDKIVKTKKATYEFDGLNVDVDEPLLDSSWNSDGESSGDEWELEPRGSLSVIAYEFEEKLIDRKFPDKKSERLLKLEFGPDLKGLDEAVMITHVFLEEHDNGTLYDGDIKVLDKMGADYDQITGIAKYLSFRLKYYGESLAPEVRAARQARINFFKERLAPAVRDMANNKFSITLIDPTKKAEWEKMLEELRYINSTLVSA